MNRLSTTVAIVGGGISGLVAAYYLEKQARAAGIDIVVTLIEREAELGGKIATHQEDGFIFEGGPESFVTRKPEAWELCHELGLVDQLVGTVSSGKNYVLHNGRPSIVPTNPGAFIKSPLLSTSGKLRLLKEPFVKPRTSPEDESLGSFLRRRIGDEAVNQLAAPAIGSIYLGDVDGMSVQVSFGRFAEMERNHGGIFKGMLALMKQKRSEQKASGLPREKKPTFATLRGGLANLVDAVADHVEGEILTGTAVSALHHNPTNAQPYQLLLTDGQEVTADLVLLATPTFVMADLLADYDANISSKLRDISYNPVTTVNVAFNHSDVEEPFDGFGVVVPETESSTLLAVEGMSVKFPHRAPDDQFVLRAFVGGSRTPELASLPDDELMTLVRKELTAIFGITAVPTKTHITRWLPANPQPPVGSLAIVAEIETRLLQQLPGLFLTGAGLRGQGIPDCIRQSRDIVEQMLAAIAEKTAVA